MKSLILLKNIDTSADIDNPLTIRESAKRFETYIFEPDHLFLEDYIPYANAYKITNKKSGGFEVSKTITKINLNDNCLVSIRLDPPFNNRYLTSLYILEKVGGKSYVTNSPVGIIRMPEKILRPELKKFLPKTLISHDEKKILDFWKKHKDIILKPLYEYGGKNVFRLKPQEENYKSILNSLLSTYKEHIVAQEYIPEVKIGDKRITFIDGEVFTITLRKPAKGQLQASVSLGGSMHKSRLTENEKEICKILKPILKENGIFFCAIDIIGKYLTEVNVTCPTIAYLANHTNCNDKDYVPSEKIYWDRLEKKLKTLNK